jgi:hypothetical protein
MSLRTLMERLFSGRQRDDEAAEREEYHLPDSREPDLERGRVSEGQGSDGIEAAGDDLESFRPPPDAAP